MEERIKKSALQAEGIFDYQKLMYPDTGLIAVKIEEEGEELLLTYNLEALTPMTEIRKEDITTRLAVLENIELLAACRKSYYFTLEPEKSLLRQESSGLCKTERYLRGRQRI